MVIFKDNETGLVYVAEIISVEQDTETMGVHYYLHDIKAKEPFSLKTPLSERKNFAPEYTVRQKVGRRVREFSIPTFHPKPGYEATQNDIRYTAYTILAAGFDMEKGTRKGRVNIPERVIKDITRFHSAAASPARERASHRERNPRCPGNTAGTNAGTPARTSDAAANAVPVQAKAGRSRDRPPQSSRSAKIAKLQAKIAAGKSPPFGGFLSDIR